MLETFTRTTKRIGDKTMTREEYQEKIIIEKYNMMIASCPYYPNCLPECNGMEMCNHIIDRAKQIDKRIGD